MYSGTSTGTWGKAIVKSSHQLHDTIFKTKLGLSQSLKVQEEVPNLNVTLKGYPKKFLGLFCQKVHKTHQMIPFHPKRGCSPLTLRDQGQTYNPKCNPKQLPDKTLGFSLDGTTHSTHSTANFCDWSASNQEHKSHYSRYCHQYLDQDLPFPNKNITWTPLTHT